MALKKNMLLFSCIICALVIVFVAALSWHYREIDKRNESMEMAIKFGKLDQIRELLKQGVPMEGSETIDPLLLIATESENFESFKLLLELGADPNDVSGIKSAEHAMRRTDFQLEILKARRRRAL